MTVSWTDIEADLRRSFRSRGVAPEVVDDLVQEAAVRLLRGLTGLRDADRVGPYVGRVVRSVWVDHLRRRRPHDELPDTVEAPAPEPMDLAPEVASWLPALVETLPEPNREAVRLSELEGWSQARIARELDLSPSGARTRVQRGRRQLRAALEACCTVEREAGRVTGWEVNDDGCSRC